MRHGLLFIMPDGALLVSDDSADAIYRISYQDSSQLSAVSDQ
jgi:glucose/arabinose dehydrogenase